MDRNLDLFKLSEEAFRLAVLSDIVSASCPLILSPSFFWGNSPSSSEEFPSAFFISLSFGCSIMDSFSISGEDCFSDTVKIRICYKSEDKVDSKNER